MRLLGIALAVLGALVAGAPAHAARPLTTGFYDSAFGEDPVWLQRAVDIQGRMIRLHFEWRDVAPATPAAVFDATDPDSPGYRWRGLDPQIDRARAAGLQIVLSFDEAPAWAEGSGRPRRIPPGAWKPDPTAVGRFGEALARRYGGRVSALQLWNEPNLEIYLAPQWRKRRGGFSSVAPHHYRRMLRAFRAGVKRHSPSTLVATGGTSPFGDPSAGESRMQPVRFLRDLLCVRRDLRRRSCRDRVQVDVIAHHPYSVGRPRRKALNPDDASIPDMGKLRRVVRAARRLGRLARTPRLWVTEVSYDSRPPDPDGIPVARHARWAEETLYLLWRSGVEVVVWLSIRDSLPNPSYDTTIQAGPFYNGGKPKPAARAFRFPFVTERVSRGRIRVWGRPPVGGTVVVERRSGSRWRPVVRVRARARGTFLRSVALRGRATLRARVGSETSLTWLQR